MLSAKTKVAEGRKLNTAVKVQLLATPIQGEAEVLSTKRSKVLIICFLWESIQLSYRFNILNTIEPDY